jgi:outer membrane lipopolysaccharide assembly protein LptE/RlpB
MCTQGKSVWLGRIQKKRTWKIGLLILLWLVLAGCGYRFSGGSYPGGSQTIYVELFENRTNVIRIESALTNDIINEITRLRRNSLLTRLRDAEAVLSGTITSITVSTVSRITTITANERRVTLTTVVSLTGKDGSELWRRTLADNEVYAVDPDDRQRTDLNQRAALERISNKLAQRIYNGLTEDF